MLRLRVADSRGSRPDISILEKFRKGKPCALIQAKTDRLNRYRPNDIDQMVNQFRDYLPIFRAEEDK